MRKSVVFGLAVVIAVAFFLTVFGSSAFEAQQAEAAVPTVESLQVGSVIQFGGYDWRVLDVQDGKALIITEHIIEQRPYNVQAANVTWETCTLRKYLNGEFLQKFTAEDQKRIAETRIQNPNNLWYGTVGGNDTNDKIFLLSLEETDRYFGNSGDYENKRRKSWDDKNDKWVSADDGFAFLNANDSNRIAQYNNQASWWWLRSPGFLSHSTASVFNDGLVYVFGFPVHGAEGGVRPALLLNLSVEADAAPTVESLMKRGWMFLEDEEWKQADEYFDWVLDIDPEHAPAFLGKLCVELKIKDEANLANRVKPLDNMRNYQRALRFADACLSKKLEGYNQAIKARPLQVGSVIQFGGYDWRVLDVQGNKALIITEHIIEQRPYNVELTEVTWEMCTLRKYLNGEFLQKFSKEEQARISETRINNPNNLWYGTAGGNDTTDKIFLLSLEEADKYFGNSGDYENKRRKSWDDKNDKWVSADDGFAFSNVNDSDRIAQYNNQVSWWYLRSPGRSSLLAAPVFYDGPVYVRGLSVGSARGGVRPALWLNLSVEADAAPIVESLQVGSVIQFGGYDWRVLDVQGNKALIITEHIIERRQYNVQNIDVSWETCTLREYLNGEFLQKFTAEDQKRISETRINNPNNLWYGTAGGNDTTDKIFLLSLEEADKYFGNSGDYENKRRTSYDGQKWVSDNNGFGFSNANDSNRIAQYNNQASWWWLRSPGRSSLLAAPVFYDGHVLVRGFSVGLVEGGVRPALLLNGMP